MSIPLHLEMSVLCFVYKHSANIVLSHSGRAAKPTVGRRDTHFEGGRGLNSQPGTEDSSILSRSWI